MTVHIDPELHREIMKFGGEDLRACMNCGNCTAECPLSSEQEAFPRKTIHYFQVGMKEKLMSSIDPWLCYYCGDCSQNCPRQANPGEIMMAARRYLTAKYDWTGLAKKLYLSKIWEISAIVLIGFFVLMLFVLSVAFTPERMPDAHVSVNTFAPVEWIHYGDWILAAVLSFFLISNGMRVFRFVMGTNKKGNGLNIPFSLYFQELKTFIVHFITQRHWQQCEDRSRWFKHFLLVLGYGTMMILVIFLLPWFQRDGADFHITSLFGYYATFILLYYTVDAMLGRYNKKEELYKHSHPTDWGFLILLFLTALSGILLHIFRLFDHPLSTYYMYVIHLMIAVPMLVIEVPFGKWAHLLYRPLAVYLSSVKQRARELSDKQSA